MSDIETFLRGAKSVMEVLQNPEGTAAQLARARHLAKARVIMRPGNRQQVLPFPITGRAVETRALQLVEQAEKLEAQAHELRQEAERELSRVKRG